MRELKLCLLAISCLATLAAPALADPWKNESGKRGFHRYWQGETPGWARGKGYWDGHFKHGRQWSPTPHCQPYSHGILQHHGRAPLAPRYRGDDFYKEQWKAQREYEKESHKAWREWQKEQAKMQRKHGPSPHRPYYGD